MVSRAKKKSTGRTSTSAKKASGAESGSEGEPKA